MHAAPQSGEDGVPFLLKLPFLHPEHEAQHDVERNRPGRVDGADGLAGLPWVDVASCELTNDLAIPMELAGVKSRRQQLPFAPVLSPVQHPQRPGASEASKACLPKGIIPGWVSRKHLP